MILVAEVTMALTLVGAEVGAVEINANDHELWLAKFHGFMLQPIWPEQVIFSHETLTFIIKCTRV